MNFNSKGYLLCDNCFNNKNITMVNMDCTKHRDEKCSECGTELQEIDELLVPIITKLNKKGYKTWTCCSGHIYNASGFILFNESYDFPEINIDGIYLDEKGWYYEDPEIHFLGIRWHGLDTTDFDESIVLENIFRCIVELNKYVDNLPNII